MSYKNGMAALNLEMTDKVPRTEYSAAEYHIDLVNAETKKMAQQIQELNTMYARMLEAMTCNMNRQQ